MAERNESALAGRMMVYCRECGQPYRAKPEMAGKKFRCKCGGVVAMPKGSDVREGLETGVTGGTAGGEDWNYDALAGLGSGGVASEPPPLPPAYAPKMSRPKPTRERSSGGGGGGVGRWLSGGFQALISRNRAPATREQQVVQYWIFGPGFVVAGIVFILFCRHAAQRHEAFMRVAQKTTGRIVHEPTVRKEGRGMRSLDPKNWRFTFPVVYMVDGKEMRQDVEVSGNALPPGFDPEDSAAWFRKDLDVYYDPGDPGHVEAAVRAEHNGWIWGYVVGAGFAAVGAWGAMTKWPH